MQTMHRQVGGGCCRVDRDGKRRILGRDEDAIKRIERDKWLKTPEGQKFIADEQIRQQQAQKRQQEQKKQRDHANKWSSLLKNPPKEGSTVQAPQSGYMVQLTGTGEGNRGFEAMVLLRVEGEYPVEPRYVIASNGKVGMLVLLDHISREWLHQHYHESIEAASSRKGRKEVLTGVNLPIEILSYGRNRSSALAKLLVPQHSEQKLAVAV